jgi:hypothetical protein
MVSFIRSLLLVAAATLALVTCSKQATPVGTSALELSLTAKPIGPLLPVPAVVTPAKIAHVYLTLQEVDVHVAATSAAMAMEQDKDDDGGQWLATVLPAASTIDLMSLQGGVSATLGRIVSLPTAKITQIRLIVDRTGQNRVMLTDGTTCALDLSQVPPTGVKITHPFPPVDVGDGNLVRIVVDVDLERSLNLTATCTYRLEPVIDVYAVERRGDDDEDHNGVDHGDHGS